MQPPESLTWMKNVEMKSQIVDKGILSFFILFYLFNEKTRIFNRHPAHKKFKKIKNKIPLIEQLEIVFSPCTDSNLFFFFF
jgi:hypothetical protein